MDKLEIHRSSALDWKPSPVISLATSLDGSKVAAVREDSSMELWLVSPGSVGWHCQLRIMGSSSGRVSSLVWCKDRLLSASIDGSVSEWDMFSLKQKVILNTVGVSIWQMAVEPSDHHPLSSKTKTHGMTSEHAIDDEYSDCESSCSDEDDKGSNSTNNRSNLRLAVACDDGCIRIYTVTDTDGLIYHRSFPRVNGRALSVVWSLDAEFLFSGSSDGIIRCWDTKSYQEKYRITVGFGGHGGGLELCVWSLLFLRCGTLVSGDSTGSVQFWDSQLGTQIQAQTYHKGDVNALANDPSHTRVFSAGSDGQVILYKMSDSSGGSEGVYSRESTKKWIYVGYKRAHSHDIRALTVAVPIISADELPEEKVHKARRKSKPVGYAYHKWAHIGVPMLISAGDDAKLFAYPTKEFTQFEPHDISPAPQRVSMQLVHNTAIDGASMMLTQYPEQLNLSIIGLNYCASKQIKIKEMAKIKSKAARKVICSAISSNGLLFAYSDHVKPRLFELKRQHTGSSGWSINELQLPKSLPYPHCMVFSVDSSHLMLAGHDRKICVVDLKSKLVHTFVPQRKEGDVSDANCEPPITKMTISSDGQWLAAINCFGDIYIFNLEINRQHWFISRLNGASVTAGGFSPKYSNVLVITTSANQIYVFDVDAKQLGEWSRRHTPHLPRRFQEFPGEVIGLSFAPSSKSTTVIVYSSRAMCLIDFGMPVGRDDYINLSSEKCYSPKKLKLIQKRKANEQESKGVANMNFDFRAFDNPTLFVGYISESSLLIIEKPWMQVLKSFDAPVHRHIYGT